MNINELKRMLEQTQKDYPPHYPTKTHDVEREINKLINNLKLIVDYIGFSEANIAIKNIIGKTINEFLISTLQGEQTKYCDFKITEENIDNGKRIIITYKDKSLVLEYHNIGVITVTNNSRCNYILHSEDYSDSFISYDINTPNSLYVAQIFLNKSTCQSLMTFNEYGIETQRELLIKPKSRNFEAKNECLMGTITRSDNDFFMATVRLNIIGKELKGIISNEDIDRVNSIPEITVPIKYMDALKYDLNLLNIVCEDDRVSSRCGGIQRLTDNYLFSEEDSEFFENDYNESKKIIANSYFLEFGPQTLAIMTPLIHSPYSFEILNNLKEYVKKQETDHQTR